MKKVIILGATSHIAKNLILHFFRDYELLLFARNTESVKEFLIENVNTDNRITILDINYFETFKGKSDVIINCIGFGTPDKVIAAGYDIYRITEMFDNLIIGYIYNNQETLYINFSSGAVYGTEFSAPVTEKSTTEIPVNNIRSSDHYRLSKIYSESKHRSLQELKIVDLRVFSFFSRFIDLGSSYLMTDIVRSIINKTELLTNDSDIVRDYIDPRDLFKLVLLVTENPFNGVLDCYSSLPVRKFEILEAFSKEFGLCYHINQSVGIIQATGIKNIYYSKNKTAEKFGYLPQFNSMDAITQEVRMLLNKNI